MSLTPDDIGEKHAGVAPGYDTKGDAHIHTGSDPENLVVGETNGLHRDLKGRHMQMIAMQVQHGL